MVKKEFSGLAIASFVIGILALIPVIGIILGIAALVFGIIALVYVNKNKSRGKGLAIAGIVLGVIGILITVLMYAALFYFMFSPNSDVFAEVKLNLTNEILMQNAVIIEGYMADNGKYPANFEILNGTKYEIFSGDFFGEIKYELNKDGTSFVLTSAGPDKAFGTQDDILYP